MDTYIPVGYTKKNYGVKGELKFHVEDQYLEDLLQTEVIFLQVGGAPVPYFVEYVRMEPTPVLKFEEVDHREAAMALSACQMLLRESDIIPESERTLEVEELPYAFCVGYQVIDVHQGSIGKVLEVQEFPQQEMALVDYQGKEILIPLNEQFILKVDKEVKQLKMELPAGLLDL